MNRTATAVAAAVLAMGAIIGAWRTGAVGPQYAKVVRATPVTVTEPRFVDVLQVVPVDAATAARPGPPAYEVSYRIGGRIERRRLPRHPGDQVRVGEQRRVIGYDVVWRWREHVGVVRLPHRPGRRLPVVDGAVVADRRGVAPRPG